MSRNNNKRNFEEEINTTGEETLATETTPEEVVVKEEEKKVVEPTPMVKNETTVSKPITAVNVEKKKNTLKRYKPENVIGKRVKTYVR